METSTLETDLSLITRIVSPDKPDFSPEMAQIILALDFPDRDRQRMEALADKANEEDLTAVEQSEAESYRRVAHWLMLLQSKARQSLRGTVTSLTTAHG